MSKRAVYAVAVPLEARRLFSSIVAVFDNPSYVDTVTTDGTPASATNLIQELQGLGDTVKTFTKVDVTSLSQALNGVDALVIPDLSKGDLTTVLTNGAQQAIRTFITGGGGYITVGDAGTNNTRLMENIFGYPSLATYGYNGQTRQTGDYSLQSGATGTAFAGGPAFNRDSGGPYFISTLSPTVPGEKDIYAQSFSDPYYESVDVALLPYASRYPVAYLGRDWSLGGPNGTEDGNWAEILRRSVVAVAKAAPTVTISVTAPAAQTATAGTAKSFTLGSFTASSATAPYTATITWGDGSTQSTVKLTAAGTIPAQSHTFAKAGTDTVTVVVTDSAGHTSNSATFKVTVAAAPAVGSIAGTVFSDTNANGKLDTGEKGLAGVKVYIDTNEDGTYTTGEPTATTTSAGAFTFANLVAGTYRIREVLSAGYVEEAPTAGYYAVTLTSAGGTKSGYVFADAPATASISGTVFGDTNGDGKLDDHELGLGAYQVYIDANDNGKLDSTERVVTTDVNGKWSFTGLTAGTYTIRVVPVSGTSATKPTGDFLTITVAAGQSSVGNLFGVRGTT